MSWITKIQADDFLSPNPQWEEFENKEELLKLASNRLEQLTFKNEPINRVGARYLDGNSLSKVAGSANFLLEANKGNFAYHEALGWTRSVDTMDLFIYDFTNSFLVNDDDANNYVFQQDLSFKQIQSLHTFGGSFVGTMALDLDKGSAGAFSMIETQQANAIVDENGEQVFLNHADRRILVWFGHDGIHCTSTDIVFDGVSTVDVIDEQGNAQTNTTPEILAGDFLNYQVKVINGLDATMFFYVNDVLVGNPGFNKNDGGKGGNRLLYQSGSGGGTDRVSYIEQFGAVINTENPVTIPIRLVGACALLAFEYGKFPPNFVGDKQYLENENDYNRMQDLPINVQAAVEPFLADYESTIVDGVATTNIRGKIPTEQETDVGIDTTNKVRDETSKKITPLEYK